MQKRFNIILVACLLMAGIGMSSSVLAEAPAREKAKDHKEKKVEGLKDAKGKALEEAEEKKEERKDKRVEKRDVRKDERARKKADKRKAWDKLSPAERSRSRAFHEGRKEVNGAMQEMHPGEREELLEQYQ